MNFAGGYMELIIKVLDRVRALAPYSNEIATIFLSIALLVGFIALCLLVVKGG